MKYTEIYERNRETGRIVIDIALDDYNDYYHEWDNAKYRKRDINPDLEKFIGECSDQIPLKESLELRFNIEDETRNEVLEKELVLSFGNFYNTFILLQKETLRGTYFMVLKSLIFGLLLLVASSISKSVLSHNLLTEIFIEGLTIGGWVFVWQAVYASAYSVNDARKRYLKILRIRSAEIVFTYNS